MKNRQKITRYGVIGADEKPISLLTGSRFGTLRSSIAETVRDRDVKNRSARDTVHQYLEKPTHLTKEDADREMKAYPYAVVQANIEAFEVIDMDILDAAQPEPANMPDPFHGTDDGRDPTFADMPRDE